MNPVLMLVVIGLSVVTLIVIFLQFTLNKEGTAKAIMEFDGFKGVVMEWEGHLLTANWDVVDAANSNGIKEFSIGGLKFVGIRFIHKVYEYVFRWRDVQLVEGKAQMKFNEKTIDYIFVRPDVYFTDLEGAETAPPERYPLDLQFLVTMRVVNPYKALFRAPSNWNENVMNRLNALFRTWISGHSLDEILALVGSPQQIWHELQNDQLLIMFQEDWGIQIEKNGIEIREIKLPPALEEAAGIEKQMELTAKGFAAQTTGALVAMIAQQTGEDSATIRGEFKTNLTTALTKYQPLIDTNRDLIIRKMGLDSGAVRQFYIEGGTTIEGLIALLGNVMGGGGSSGSSSGSGSKQNPKQFFGMKP